MPFIYEIDSPDVCPRAKQKDTWQSKRSIRAHNAVVQKVGRAHSRRTNERTFVFAGILRIIEIDRIAASPPQDAAIEPCGPCFNMTGICF
jgi:hypothetical protein